jgi:hypothetical protein
MIPAWRRPPSRPSKSNLQSSGRHSPNRRLKLTRPPQLRARRLILWEPRWAETREPTAGNRRAATGSRRPQARQPASTSAAAGRFAGVVAGREQGAGGGQAATRSRRSICLSLPSPFLRLYGVVRLVVNHLS